MQTIPARHRAPANRLAVYSPLLGVLVGLTLITIGPAQVHAQGIALRGVGPVNESMGGAATAAPIDSIGALLWNPASISGICGDDMSFGMTLILPSTKLGSGFGPFGAWTDSEPGVTPVPSMGFVRHVEGTPLSYGLGIFGVGGCSVNYPCDLRNLILTPQPPHGLGLGRLSANVDVFQIAPTVAYELNENWSIGFAPTLTIGKLYASPLFLGPKNNADGDGFATYSSGVGTRYIWGGGFQLGAYYTNPNGWHFGASLKSPQWMEPARYKSEDELRRPETIKFDLNYPLIASVGVAYSGWEKWIVAVDFRYFDYANTPGFENGGFNADGSLSGLGWESIGSMAIGVQRQLSDRLFVRGGYCLNGNPVTADSAIYNVASPLIVKNSVHTGFSYVFADNWIAAVAYTHVFENDAKGPIHDADGTIPFSWVSSKASADAFSLGITKRF